MGDSRDSVSWHRFLWLFSFGDRIWKFGHDRLVPDTSYVAIDVGGWIMLKWILER
jgi:hypothetical protein